MFQSESYTMILSDKGLKLKMSVFESLMVADLPY